MQIVTILCSLNEIYLKYLFVFNVEARLKESTTAGGGFVKSVEALACIFEHFQSLNAA